MALRIIRWLDEDSYLHGVDEQNSAGQDGTPVPDMNKADGRVSFDGRDGNFDHLLYKEDGANPGDKCTTLGVAVPV